MYYLDNRGFVRKRTMVEITNQIKCAECGKDLESADNSSNLYYKDVKGARVRVCEKCFNKVSMVPAHDSITIKLV